MPCPSTKGAVDHRTGPIRPAPGFRSVRTLLLILAVTLWTTVRHEASHALVAWLGGTRIDEMRLLPGIHPEAGFYFGYVIYGGETSWLATAAPYLTDLLLLLAALALISLSADWRRYRRLILLFGVVSPMVDLAYGYQGGLWRPATDVADLFEILPPAAVNVFFAGAIGLSVYLFRRLRTSRA